MTDTDVVIAGAGPTGLMAAVLLQRCGVRFRILDKGDQPAHESRAFAVQARSLELLESVGLSEEFLRRGLIAPGAQIIVDGKVRAELNLDDLGATDTPYSFIFMLPQSEIEEILLDDLKKNGVRVERNREITGFTEEKDGVRVNTGKGDITARYLIGADGAHSVVRKTMGLSFEGAAYEQQFLLADCKITWPWSFEHLKVFMRGSSLALYLPLKGPELGRVVAVRNRSTEGDSAASEAATTAEAVSLKEVEEAFRAATGPAVRLSKPGWTASYRIHHRGVDRYGKGRAFVAGDAAHIHSPAGGQGMNTGLQDAANLAWKLALALRSKKAAARAETGLLHTYHLERWPVGQLLLAFTDRIFQFATSPRGWQARLRNAVAPRVMRFVSHSDLRKRAFRFISQLGIRYEANPFVVDSGAGRSKRGPRAGHRAPNATIARHREVFDLIKGYRFHALAISRKSLSRTEIAEISEALGDLPKDIGLPLETHLIGHSLSGYDDRILQAESSQVFLNYGIESRFGAALLLVRPDGHIAYRADDLKIEGLRRFIEKMSATS